MILFWVVSFKNKARGDPEVSRREGGGLIWLDMAYFMIILAKEEDKSTPFYSTFKLKYRKIEKLTIFLMETSLKAQK